MKKLLSLLLIIFVSAISWYSCPQKKVINVTTIYNLTYPVEHSLLLTPTLTTRKTTAVSYTHLTLPTSDLV